MPRRNINLVDTENLLLVYMYNHASKERGGHLYVHELYDNLNVSVALIDIAIDALQDDGFCSRYDLELELFSHAMDAVGIKNSKCVRITKMGINNVELWSDNFHDSMVRIIDASAKDQVPAEYLSGSETSSEAVSSQIPASDRYVTITHNREYEHTLRTLDEAIREFKADHSFDNDLGQEKSALIGALESGRQLLEDTKIWLPTAISILVQPLKRIAAKYREAAIQGGTGAVIHLALEQILSLFGLE